MSTLQVTNIQATGETASRAVSGVAAAWVNANSDTVNESFNIASITDNGTGDFSPTFTNAMSNSNYVHLGTCKQGAADNNDMRVLTVQERNVTTTVCRIRRTFANGAGNENDGTFVLGIQGDLA